MPAGSVQRPDQGAIDQNHEARIRALERAPRGSPRISYGQVYNDGLIIDAGSGDWTAEEVGIVVTVTFSPPFASPPTVLLTANNNNAAAVVSPAPYFVEQGAIAADHFDTVVYEQDGTPNDGGFNFVAVGT